LSRILICHDWAVVREGMITQLESEDDLTVVSTTDSGMSAVIEATSGSVDLIVTGLQVSGLAGLEILRRVREGHVPVRVIVVLNGPDPKILAELLRLSPDGLIVQECSSDEFRYTVRAVSEGRTILAGPVAEQLVDWFCSAGAYIATTPEHMDTAVESLTARELEILRMIASGLTTEEISHDLGIGSTTVRTHLYRLRFKLDVRDRAGLVGFAYRNGVVAAGVESGTGGGHSSASLTAQCGDPPRAVRFDALQVCPSE